MDALNQILFDDKSFSDLIKEYMDISVKNDDALLKMAAIVQRLSTGTSTGGDGGLLTDAEMEQLQQVAEEITKEHTQNPKLLENK